MVPPRGGTVSSIAHGSRCRAWPAGPPCVSRSGNRTTVWRAGHRAGALSALFMLAGDDPAKTLKQNTRGAPTGAHHIGDSPDETDGTYNGSVASRFRNARHWLGAI